MWKLTLSYLPEMIAYTEKLTQSSVSKLNTMAKNFYYRSLEVFPATKKLVENGY